MPTVVPYRFGQEMMYEEIEADPDGLNPSRGIRNSIILVVVFAILLWWAIIFFA